VTRLASTVAVAAFATVLSPVCAWAEPGLAAEVYGPGVSEGETELELRSGILNGGAADGEWQTKVEVSHAFTDWWRTGVVAEWEYEGASAAFTAISIENVFDFTGTRDWPVHLGGYLEYESKQDGADEIELKLLMQRTRGAVDLRLNLIGERHVGAGASNDWEFGYATQAGYSLNDDFEVGVQGFGDVGTDGEFGNLGGQAHYWGPFAQFEIGHVGRGEVELQLGYLAGIGEAAADGQFRLKLEYEFGQHEQHP
jgi:hypothetical protein